MNRLQLCQTVHRYLRNTQDLPGTAPTTTISQTGMLYEIVSFVDDAYLDLQTYTNWWRWRAARGSFAISSSARVYSRSDIQVTLSDYEQYLPMVAASDANYILVYLTATGVSDEIQCTYVPYQFWSGYWDAGTIPSGKPQFFTLRPDRGIEFDRTPDAAYTVVIDYLKTIDTMTLDASEPIIPSEYHDSIIWGAIIKYCNVFDNTDSKMQKAQREYNRIFGRLCFDQLPRYTMNLTELYGVNLT